MHTSQRPLSKRERETSAGGIIEVHPPLAGQPHAMTVHEPKLKVDMTAYTEQHRFMYDTIFDEGVGNRDVYRASAAPLISRVFEHGQSSTCFAYGATGAGKTHTMMGTEEEPGLYILAARDIFELLATPAHASLQLHVASYEIYGGKVFDLLSGRSMCPVREDGKKKVNIVGLRETHGTRCTRPLCTHAHSHASSRLVTLSRDSRLPPRRSSDNGGIPCSVGRCE